MGTVGELQKCYGIYRGTVASNKDPLVKRRLKLTIPAVLGNKATDWAWPLETASLKSEPPAVGQGVWVMFENGDPSYPVWVGTFGKIVTSLKHVLVKPDNISGTYIVTSKHSDGRIEVDLLATLEAMSEKLDDLEANKSDIGHTHPGL